MSKFASEASRWSPYLYHYIPLVSRGYNSNYIGIITPVTHLIPPFIGGFHFQGPTLEPCNLPTCWNQAVVGFQIGDGSLCGTGPVAQIGRLTSPKKAFPGCQRSVAVHLYRNFIAFSECRFFFWGLIYIIIVFLKLLSLSFLFDQFFHITSNIKSPDKKYVGVFNKSITVAASITDMQDNLHGPGPGAYVSRSNFPNEKMRRARSVPDFMSRLGSFRGEI